MLLKKLSEAYGVSGDEGNVRSLLRTGLQDYAEELTTELHRQLICKKDWVKSPV